MAKYRTASLKDIQLGPILQEMTEISMRHDVPLPASLALTGEGARADAARGGASSTPSSTRSTWPGSS